MLKGQGQGFKEIKYACKVAWINDEISCTKWLTDTDWCPENGKMTENVRVFFFWNKNWLKMSEMVCASCRGPCNLNAGICDIMMFYVYRYLVSSLVSYRAVQLKV